MKKPTNKQVADAVNVNKALATKWFENGFKFGNVELKHGYNVDGDDALRGLWCRFNLLYGTPVETTKSPADRRAREMAWGAFKSGAFIGNGMVV